MTETHLQYIKSEDFENADDLWSLDLCHNDIERIEANTFVKMIFLYKINLAYNRIEYIDDNAFHLPALKWIYLGNNRLTTINCEQFVVIHLMKDDRTIDIESVLNEVELCDLSNNPLANNGSAVLVQARSIHMQNASVECLHIFVRTKVVKAQDNQIADIVLEDNADGEQEFQLVFLNLTNNWLTSVANLSTLYKLKEIDLSFNLLESLDEAAFENMTSLRLLSLDHNRLKNIDLEFVRHTPSLEFLDISYNGFGAFEFKVTAPSLQELRVEGNNLTEIDMDIKQMAPELIRIGLNDNNWNCEYLKRLAAYMFKVGVSLVFNENVDIDVLEQKYTRIEHNISCFN